MGRLLLLHGVGAAGGLLARRLRVPAGAMIGAMVAVVVLNAATGTAATYPMLLRALVQSLSGALIGSRFLKSDVVELRVMMKPACILMAMLLSLNMLFAFLISSVSSVDMITALFACAPGGVSDLALIAEDFGANTDAVTILQMFRFIFVVAFFPPFMKRRYLNGMQKPQSEIETVSKEVQKRSRHALLVHAVLPLCCASACGMLLRTWGVPAGAVIGSMAVIVTINLIWGKALLPGWLKTCVQICCGSYIGNQVTRASILSLRQLVLPMGWILVEVLVMAFVSAWVIRRLTRLEWVTCLFSSIPGGIAEMGLIAEEMRLDTPKIVVMHTCRVILTICLMPILVKFFA